MFMVCRDGDKHGEDMRHEKLNPDQVRRVIEIYENETFFYEGTAKKFNRENKDISIDRRLVKKIIENNNNKLTEN